jgi:hypothetical protein
MGESNAFAPVRTNARGVGAPTDSSVSAPEKKKIDGVVLIF